MSERITVPATLPGVVRPFTPLLPPKDDKSFGDYIRGCAVEVITDTEDINGDPAPPELFGDIVWLYKTSREITLPCACDSVHLQGWMVDLEDATGRAHVAWAVAAALDLGDVTTARVALVLVHPGPPEKTCCVQVGTQGTEYIDVVWLECDPSDDTRLADGSRRVDALALRAVALHILGGDS